MKIDRRTSGSTAALLACAAIFAVASWAEPAAAARFGAPPFCVRQGGPRGFLPPQICRFFDYRQCLQAAADLNGNCVVNIDYHGDVSTLPGSDWSRARR